MFNGHMTLRVNEVAAVCTRLLEVPMLPVVVVRVIDVPASVPDPVQAERCGVRGHAAGHGAQVAIEEHGDASRERIAVFVKW